MTEVLFYVPFFAAYLFMIGKGVREVSIHNRLKHKGVRATGTVTAIHHTGGRESITTQEIEFRDAQGGHHQFKSRPGMSYPAVGAAIRVYYLPENSKVVRVVDRGIKGACSMIFFGAVLAGLLIWNITTVR